MIGPLLVNLLTIRVEMSWVIFQSQAVVCFASVRELGFYNTPVGRAEFESSSWSRCRRAEFFRRKQRKLVPQAGVNIEADCSKPKFAGAQF